MQKTNNFLNNQKYIFWEKEKRKILSLYLISIYDKIFLTFLSYVTTLWIGILLLILFLSFWVFSYLKIEKPIGLIFFLLTFWNAYLLYIAYKSIHPLKCIKDFFFIQNNNIIHNIINILFIAGLFIISFISIGKIVDHMNMLLGIFVVFVYLWLTFFFIISMITILAKMDKEWYLKINILHVILSPIIFIIWCFLFICTYIFLSFKKYIITKTFSKKKLLFKNYYEITKK